MTTEVRRRKLKDQNVGPKTKRPSKRKDVSSMQKSLICMIVSGSILILFLVFYVDTSILCSDTIDRIAYSIGLQSSVHAVVIDAGSTGSRVLAFTFHKSYLDSQVLKLDKELFVETKPGLSSFAENPEKGAQSIATLLEKAKHEIPEKYWSKTGLVLKATAGLRLLPPAQAEGLLDAVRATFTKSPFHTTPDSVSIMDGVDEGIFSWFTVNFLLDRLSVNSDRTVAALDLGGGSTQVTFAPVTPATLKQTQYLHEVDVPKGKIPMYTHSYLGLGLMAARKEILSHKAEESARNLSSACVNPFIRGKEWKYGGATYIVNGLPEKVARNDPEVDFKTCSKIIMDYIDLKVIPLQELGKKTINAFSYYFDRASESGLIDPYEGGIVTVEQFFNAAKSQCSTINVDQPFMCLDLTFIWALLQEGLGLKSDTKLHLYKKINGHEISWALGAAFSMLKKEH